MIKLKFKELHQVSSGIDACYRLELVTDDELPNYSTYEEIGRKECFEGSRKYGELFLMKSSEDPRLYAFGFNEFEDGKLSSYHWSSNSDSINRAFGTNLIEVCINNNGWIAMDKKEVEAFLPEGYKIFGPWIVQEVQFEDHEFDPTIYEYMQICDYSTNRLKAWSTNPRPLPLKNVMVRRCLNNDELYYIYERNY